MKKSILDHKPAIQAIGWIMLWSSPLVESAKHLPQITKNLLIGSLLSLLVTIGIKIYGYKRGCHSDTWSDSRARIAALVTLLILLLPHLLERFLSN